MLAYRLLFFCRWFDQWLAGRLQYSNTSCFFAGILPQPGQAQNCPQQPGYRLYERYDTLFFDLVCGAAGLRASPVCAFLVACMPLAS